MPGWRKPFAEEHAAREKREQTNPHSFFTLAQEPTCGLVPCDEDLKLRIRVPHGKPPEQGKITEFLSRLTLDELREF